MASLSLVQHYFEYLKSPPVLLAILAVVGPIVLEIFKNQVLASRAPPEEIPRCFRLGLSKRSNLDDQSGRKHHRSAGAGDASTRDSPSVQALFTYPITSCRGIELAASEVGPFGLKYDGTFTFAQLVSEPDLSSTKHEAAKVSSKWNHRWRAIAESDVPRLASLRTELWVPDPRSANGGDTKANGKSTSKTSKRPRDRRETDNGPSVHQKPVECSIPKSHPKDSWAANGGCLIVKFLYEPDINLFGSRTDIISIRLPLIPSSERAKLRAYTYDTLAMPKGSQQAMNVTSEIPANDLAKLRYHLGISNTLGLFRVDDSDACRIINLASVHAVEDKLLDKTKTSKDEPDATRHRANIYVTGGPAHAEDFWKRVAIGRCVKPRHEVYRGRTTGDAASARDKDKKFVETDGEYYATNTTTGAEGKNEASANAKTALTGLQMKPLFQQGILRVGDEIKILETNNERHGEEAMFP